MKSSFIFFLLFFFKSVSGQVNFSGGYKLSTTGDIKNISAGTILKLNCNKTFILEDTLATGYGKWIVKNNNRLRLQFDSIAENSRMDIVNTKIFYFIEDGRIFRKTIPKKEYNEIKKVVRGFQHGGKIESFSIYKEKALKQYYQKISAYTCEQ